MKKKAILKNIFTEILVMTILTWIPLILLRHFSPETYYGIMELFDLVIPYLVIILTGFTIRRYYIYRKSTEEFNKKLFSYKKDIETDLNWNLVDIEGILLHFQHLLIAFKRNFEQIYLVASSTSPNGEIARHFADLLNIFEKYDMDIEKLEKLMQLSFLKNIDHYNEFLDDKDNFLKFFASLYVYYEYRYSTATIDCLTLRQFRVLRYIANQHPDSILQSNLTSHFTGEIDKSTISRHLKKFEKLGLIEFNQQWKDLRLNKYRLTHKGFHSY